MTKQRAMPIIKTLNKEHIAQVKIIDQPTVCVYKITKFKSTKVNSVNIWITHSENDQDFFSWKCFPYQIKFSRYTADHDKPYIMS